MIDHEIYCTQRSSLEAQENTLTALNLAASYGAYAVECDPRWTADGVAVIFHDDTLERLVGDPRRISDVTLAEMQSAMAKAGLEVTTLDDLMTGYKGSSAVLFDLPRVLDETFYMKLASAPFPAITGVHALDEVEVAKKYFVEENILAFIPSPDMAGAFSAAGAGIIRLWEHWLLNYPIAAVRKKLPSNREIWIMCMDTAIKHPLFSMNGSPGQLALLKAQGADGVLLNDVAITVNLKL